MDFVLHISFFAEQAIKVHSLLVVLVFNVHKERLYVLRLRIGAMFVQSQIVISELAFVLADVLNQGLVLALKSDVGLVVLVDVFYLLLHFLNFASDFNVLLLHLIGIVVAIVDLSAGPNRLRIHPHHAVVCDWSVYCVDF